MSALAREVRSARIALGLLTRLPVDHGPTAPAELGRAAGWFPVVGALLGACMAIAARLLVGRLGSSLTATVAIAALAALTGGLHLDGLGDVFDGLAAARGDRERMLAVMRDSRVGAAGAAAISLVLIAKVLATGELLARGELGALVVFPAIGRWTAVVLMARHRSARSEGLGRSFAAHTGAREVTIATAVVLVLVVWMGRALLMPAALALVAALAFGSWIGRRLDGLTGDVYGAAVELSEVVVLAGLIAAGS